MANIADALEDKYISRAADLERLKESVRQRSLGYLRELQTELERQIRDISPTEPAAPSWRRRRLEKLLAYVKVTIREAYSAARSAANREIRPLVREQAGFTVSTLNSALGVDIASVTLTPERISALMSDTLIEGAPSGDWWSRQESNLLRKFEDQIRQGVLQGETNAQLVQRVRGTATGKREVYWLNGKRKVYVEFAGGIMETGTRQAEALVRSSVQAVSNEANLETLRQNSDIVQGVQAVVTLDLRTTTICIGRSSAVWDLETGKPISGTTESFPGAPPWHWNCRTFLIPYLKSWESLRRKQLPPGKHNKILEIEPTTRASMDGQVAAGTSYEAWLRSKPKSVQLEKLGPTKYELWQENKITFTDLVNQRGRPLTVAELQEKYA